MYKKIITTLFLLTLLTSVIAKEESSKIFVSYPFSNNVKLFSEIDAANPLLPGKYKLQGEVGFKTEKRQVIFDSLNLDWQAVIQSSNYLIDDNRYLWQPSDRKVEDARIKIPLTISNKFAEFDALHIHYDELFPNNPSQPVLEMLFESEDENLVVLAGKKAFKLTPLETIDVATAAWLEKDNLYLTRRELGFSFDNNWRYAQDANNTVIQRRIHKNLVNVEAMDLLLKPGFSVTGINLLLGFEDKLKYSEIVEWAVIPKEKIDAVWRLNLGELIRKNYANKEQVFLEEVVVFVKGSMAENVQNRVLKKLVFQGVMGDKKPVDKVIHLPTRIIHKSPKQKIFSVDVHSLGDEWVLKKMFFYMQANKLNEFSGFELGQARLVSQFQEPVPVSLLRQCEEMSSWWGGLKNEQCPKIKFYFPFNTLSERDWYQSELWQNDQLKVSANAKAKFRVDSQADLSLKISTSFLNPSDELVFELDSKDNEIELNWDNSKLALDLVEPYKQRLLRGKFIGIDDKFVFKLSSRNNHNSSIVISQFQTAATQSVGTRIVRDNFKLSTSQPLSSWRIDNGGLIISSLYEDVVEIEFKQNLLLSADSRFRLEGTVESGILNLGERQWAIRGNLAIDLGNVPINADSIKLRLRLKPGTIKLRNLVFFQAGDKQDIVNIQKPNHSWKILKATDIVASPDTMIINKDGNLKLVLNNNQAFNWKTIIGKPVNELRWLHFSYQIPWSVPALDKQWLSLHFVTQDNEEFTYPLLLDKAAGEVKLFLPDILPASNKIIKEIRWQVKFSPRQMSTWAFNMKLEHIGLSYVKDLIKEKPILNLNGQQVFLPTKMNWQELVEDGKKLELGSWELDESSKIKFLEHPFLEVKNVVFESEVLDSSQIELLLTTDKMVNGGGSGLLSKLKTPLIILLLIVFFWWSWKKGWLLWIWRYSKKRATNVFQQIKHKLITHALLLNRLFGLVCLVAGFWWLGRVGNGFWLPTLLILLAGVIWQELRMLKGWATKNRCPPYLYLLAIAWAAWSLGQLSHNSEALWYLLPLVAALYFWIHRLREAFKLIWSQQGQIVVWLLVASFLYWQGIQQTSGRGENYFFTFGGIAVVLMWSNLMQLLKPMLMLRWKQIYGGAGTHYIVGFMLILVMVAILLVIKLEPIAEQLAVIGYYMLVVGVVLEAWALRKNDKKICTE
jgi:hypothetical protein